MAASKYTVRTGFRDSIRYLQMRCLPGDTPVELDSRSLCWMAFEGDIPVAFVILYRYTNCWYLKRAGTLLAHEGNRLYPRLLSTAFKAARAEGIKLVVTDCANWNTRSANGLIRAGFRLYTPAHKWGWEDGLYWEKHL